MTLDAGAKFVLTSGVLYGLERIWKFMGFHVSELIAAGVLIAITFALLRFATDRLGG